MAKKMQVDGARTDVERGGRPPALKAEHIVQLRSIVSEMPHATLVELAAELEHRGAARVCAATIRSDSGHISQNFLRVCFLTQPNTKANIEIGSVK